MKGQGVEHDKRHFLLSLGERLKVYKLNLSPCIVFSYITHNMGISSFFPCLILASCSRPTHLTTYLTFFFPEPFNSFTVSKQIAAVGLIDILLFSVDCITATCI